MSLVVFSPLTSSIVLFMLRLCKYTIKPAAANSMAQTTSGSTLQVGVEANGSSRNRSNDIF